MKLNLKTSFLGKISKKKDKEAILVETKETFSKSNIFEVNNFSL
jgi:hypothetical protein